MKNQRKKKINLFQKVQTKQDVLSRFLETVMASACASALSSYEWRQHGELFSIG